MAVATEAANSEKKQLPNERETIVWKSRKECLLKKIPNVPDSKSEENEPASASPSEGDTGGSLENWYNIHSDLGEWDGEVSNTPHSLELQDASDYEVEDWDKELEESTYGPYDPEDLSCGSFEDNNLVGLCVWKENWFYNPGCHHTPCFACPPQVRIVENGQFDDADE